MILISVKNNIVRRITQKNKEKIVFEDDLKSQNIRRCQRK